MLGRFRMVSRGDEVAVGLGAQMVSQSWIPHEGGQTFSKLVCSAVDQPVRKMAHGMLEGPRAMAEDGNAVTGVFDVFAIRAALGKIIDLEMGDPRIERSNKALVGFKRSAGCVFDEEVMIAENLSDSFCRHQAERKLVLKRGVGIEGVPKKTGQLHRIVEVSSGGGPADSRLLVARL